MSDATPSAFDALKHRDFALYVGARVLATLAWQMLTVAVGWQVYALTRDPLALGLTGLVQFLPFVSLVLPAGQLADIADRRLVLIGAYACEVLSASVMLWFTLTAQTAIWPVYTAMACFGVGRALWMPTGQAIMPNLVPTALFPRALALNSTVYQAAAIAGPSLGGLLYLLGPTVVYAVVVVFLGLAMGLIIAIRADAGANAPCRLAVAGHARRPPFRVQTPHGARRAVARFVRGAVRRRHPWDGPWAMGGS